ncbi:MAG: hypothetical protein QE284_03740, partial [Rhizobium sp.]|nr:hypothetical protein [Rhizobium sp.]
SNNLPLRKLRMTGKHLSQSRILKKDRRKSTFQSWRAGFSLRFGRDLGRWMEEAEVFAENSLKTGTFHAFNPASGDHPAH